MLSVGLPPSKAAGSDTFRVDHVTAVIAAMQETGDAGAYLAASSPGFEAAFAPPSPASKRRAS
ncbi:MAG: hypothetical protein IPN07_07220 [Dehalococcoidia bacterium]|nr:hypothetical protein [Dehalococcoidia bacterium]